MPEPETVSFTAERRIRAVFARRRGDDRYAWSTPAYVFMMQGVERQALAMLSRNGMACLNRKRILEIGCGTGYWLREFVRWGAQPQNVVGVDLLADRVREARALCAQSVQVFGGSAAALPLRSASFDVVAQFTVFTSILEPDLRRRVALEMLRVARPGGIILWYDFFYDNPKNADVRGVGEREIRGLFPGCSVGLRRVTLAPPIVRGLASRAWWLCSLLETIPLLRTHYLGLIRKE